MIFLDYSQIIIADACVLHSKFDDVSVSDIRNFFFASLLKIAQKFKPTYGEIVICCDSRRSWRHDVFPYYKENRKKERSKIAVDWEMVFASMDAIKQELKDNFPYRVVEVENAEGDDVIAVLVRHFYENVESNSSMFREAESVLIVSEDKDFKQLQIMSNVDQYSLKNGKMIRENRPDLFLREQIVRGDRQDGVPNFLSDDDSFVLKKRQKPIMEKDLEVWIEFEDVEEFPESAKVTEETKTNWRRNKQLIDLTHDEIPSDLRRRIVESYNNAHVAPKTKIFEYFLKKRVKSAIDGIPYF